MSKKFQCEYVDMDNDRMRCQNMTGTDFCLSHCRKFNKCIFVSKITGKVCNKQCRDEYCGNHSENTKRIKREYAYKRYQKEKEIFKWVKTPIENLNVIKT